MMKSDKMTGTMCARTAHRSRAPGPGDVRPSAGVVETGVTVAENGSGKLGRPGGLIARIALALAVPMRRAVDGVVDVVGGLSFAVDDTHRPMAADVTGD
jgi:hypothetical protein